MIMLVLYRYYNVTICDDDDGDDNSGPNSNNHRLNLYRQLFYHRLTGDVWYSQACAQNSKVS
jgi:hypothetical protein